MKRPGRHPDDRELASLAVPAFFTFLAAPLYELTDTAIVGRLGVAQLAGLAAAVAAFATVFFVINSVTTGLAGSIARRRGTGDERAVFEMWVSGAWFATSLGAVCGLALAVFAPALMSVLGTSGAVRGFAITYLRISTLGLPPLMLAAACTNYLRAGTGDARTPLFITIGANVANLVLEILFVWVFGWGVAGSAWSTVLVQWLALVVFLAFVFRGVRGLEVRMVPRRAHLGEVTQVAGWMVVRTIALTAALTMLTATAARISEPALAANQIAYQVWLFLAFAVSGIEVAVNALVGKHLGAARSDAARRVARRSLEHGVVLGLVALPMVFVFRYPLASLFTNDPAVRDLAASALVIVACMQPVAAFSFTFDGLFVGSGDVRFLAAQTTTAFVCVFLPGAMMVLAFDWGLDALWLVMAAWVAWRALLGTIRYAQGRWARAVSPDVEGSRSRRRAIA